MKKKIIMFFAAAAAVFSFGSFTFVNAQVVEEATTLSSEVSTYANVTDSDIENYIAGKTLPGQQHYLYDLLVNKSYDWKYQTLYVGWTNRDAIGYTESPVFQDDDYNIPEQLTFEKGKLYLINASIITRIEFGTMNPAEVWYDEDATSLMDELYNFKSYQNYNLYPHINYGDDLTDKYEDGYDYSYSDFDSTELAIVKEMSKNFQNKLSYLKTLFSYPLKPGINDYRTDIFYNGYTYIIVPNETFNVSLQTSKIAQYAGLSIYIGSASLSGSDFNKPSVTTPDSYIVNVDKMESLESILTHVVVTDDTDPNPTLHVRSSSYNSNNRVLGTYPVTIYAMDAAGNTSNDSTFNVIVADVTDPTATPKLGYTMSNDQPDFPSKEELIKNLFDISDNYYSFEELTIEYDYEYCVRMMGIAGKYTVEVTVTDPSGNSTWADNTYVIEDHSKPVISANDMHQPNNEQLSEEDLLALFTARDETTTEAKLKKELTLNQYSSNWSRVGAYQVTCKVTDEAGNYETKTITITVDDAVPPTGESKGITVSYTKVLTDDEILAAVTASDDQVEPTKTVLDRSAYDAISSQTGNVIIKVRISDGTNYIDIDVPVLIIDDVKPTIIGPTSITVGNNVLLTDEELKAKFTVTDVIDGDILEFEITDPGNYLKNYKIVGTYIREIVAKDASGNVQRLEVKMVVEDKIAPEIWYDRYFIVLQEGEILTDEMIKSYACQALNISKLEIIGLVGEYDTNTIGQYEVTLLLTENRTKAFVVSVAASEGTKEDKSDGFDIVKFFSFENYWPNLITFNLWPQWSFWIWTTWIVGSGIILSLLLTCLFGRKKKK